MPEVPDYSDDILDYLRERRGKLTKMMQMTVDLTKRVKGRNKSREVRGYVLRSLSMLIRQKKVIRYRKITMVRKRPRSSQGLIRISELIC